MSWDTVADTFETASKGIKVVLPGDKVEIFEVSGNCSRIQASVYPAIDPKERTLNVQGVVSGKWVLIANFPGGQWSYVRPL